MSNRALKSTQADSHAHTPRALEGFRPLLSGKITDPRELKHLNYPLIGSPKYDGIRVLIHPTKGAITRSSKPIRNRLLRQAFAYLTAEIPEADCLDGEITYGPPSLAVAKDVFQKTTSSVMSYEGDPVVTYWVFDHFSLPDQSYGNRLNYLRNKALPVIQAWLLQQKEQAEQGQMTEAGRVFSSVSIWIREAPHMILRTPKEVDVAEEHYITGGYEGIMLRDPTKPYKFGRSALTRTQQHLIKIKRWVDAEGLILGFEELYRNQNEQTEDEYGLAERSAHQENMVAADTLGALRIKILNGDHAGKVVKVGSGFSEALRDKIWQNRDTYLKRAITFKYQEVGIKDLPRFPIFKHFRHEDDFDV